jgi:hypothetical protein
MGEPNVELGSPGSVARSPVRPAANSAWSWSCVGRLDRKNRYDFAKLVEARRLVDRVLASL